MHNCAFKYTGQLAKQSMHMMRLFKEFYARLTFLKKIRNIFFHFVQSVHHGCH
jgi:hypothetical protein